MELYQNAEMEIVKFSAEDVIATSGGCDNVTDDFRPCVIGGACTTDIS